MDGRIDHFSYLIEEVESGFFQKAADEIAAEPSREEAKTIAAVPERFQKLATLVYQSSQHGLTKQASESLFDVESIGSYEDILNRVAASSPWEPLGMTKSALEYLDALEEIGVEGEELDKLAYHILDDTMETDAVIEASINGDSYEELSKIARAGVVRRVLGLFRAPKGVQPVVPSAGRDIQQMAHSGLRTMGREAKRLGKKEIVKPGKFRAVGKAIQQRGIRDVATAPFRRAGQAVSRGYRKAVGGLRQRAKAARSEYLTKLQQKRMDLRKELPGASRVQKAEINNRIKDVNRQIEKQKGRVQKVVRKQKASLAKAEGKAKPAPKPAAKPTAEAPSARPPKEAVEGKGVGVMDAWTKWGEKGWAALTDLEKSRLIRAGVLGGTGAVAYKTVFGD